MTEKHNRRPHNAPPASGNGEPRTGTPPGTSGPAPTSEPGSPSGQTVGPLVRHLTRTRRRIYEALLTTTEHHWTVRGLAETLPDITAHTLRDHLNLLLAERIVKQVPHQRALTVELTEQGRQTLTAILRGGRSGFLSSLRPPGRTQRPADQ
ncbi:hypothetical protein O7626_03435 [Micromonospora sp. WMMD1102]|uniref:hypothetical protein n=1 Tax=Micromonospora sp. WMMD1102 TaxID=3016105 RepID=UPI00241567D5|nr:hypothetical protein [Micromonospora sp. WMMD1102]MDG4784993.1 hypothetical protein [Micromonospora sp. WMMD1102]